MSSLCARKSEPRGWNLPVHCGPASVDKWTVSSLWLTCTWLHSLLSPDVQWWLKPFTSPHAAWIQVLLGRVHAGSSVGESHRSSDRHIVLQRRPQHALDHLQLCLRRLLSRRSYRQLSHRYDCLISCSSWGNTVVWQYSWCRVVIVDYGNLMSLVCGNPASPKNRQKHSTDSQVGSFFQLSYCVQERFQKPARPTHQTFRQNTDLWQTEKHIQTGSVLVSCGWKWHQAYMQRGSTVFISSFRTAVQIYLKVLTRVIGHSWHACIDQLPYCNALHDRAYSDTINKWVRRPRMIGDGRATSISSKLSGHVLMSWLID